MAEKNNEINYDYINERISKAKEFLEKKYNESFEVTDYMGQPFMSNYYEVRAFSNKYPEMMFTASVSNDKEGVSDSYAAKLVSKRFSDIVSKNLDGIKGYVYVYSETFVKEFPLDSADISVEEFADIIENNLMKVYVFVCADNETTENLYSSYCNIFNSLEKFSGTLYWYMTDEDMLKDIQKYIESNITLSFDFVKMTEKNIVIEDVYYKGVPQISKDNFMTKMGKCI